MTGRIITLTPSPALDFSFATETLAPNRKMRCGAPQIDPGGGGVNAARAAHRLGADVFALFAAGGVLGEALIEALNAEGLPSQAVRVASDTRLAFHARETSTGNEYRFNFSGGAMTAGEIEKMLSILKEHTGKGDYVVGSGSLPENAPEDFWARAASITKTAGARFILDSTDGEPAAIREGLYLLRKNRLEAAELAGEDLEWPKGTERFARRFIDANPLEKLVLTHGGEGALMASRNGGVVYAAGHDVPIVSAVGAGDAFVGALTTAFLKGKPDADALRFAMAAANGALQTPGTALFDPAEVMRLYETASA